MTPAEFSYELPPELIAQTPLPRRSASRLLHLLPAGGQDDLGVADFPELLEPGDLVVVNDTRVLPARLFGRKASGGRIEMLLERQLDTTTALAQLRASHAPLAGARLTFDGGVEAVVAGRDGPFFILEFDEPLQAALDAHGHMPLPPYIERPDEPVDRERYQTVFAREPGAVAAPTAGLHFGVDDVERLRARGVGIEAVTLHVGAGTFAPLRQAQLDAGELHAERVHVPAGVAEAIQRTQRAGRRVVALGTTTMRALETAARASGRVEPYDDETTLFIRPGFEFRAADALLTNFHLPESSLLMLVCAFAGTRTTLAAYAHAVRERYRFFSYGDAMFCHRSVS